MSLPEAINESIPCVRSAVTGGRSVSLPQVWLGDTLAPFCRNGEHGRGPTPRLSCARSDQTVRLGTKERAHGMEFDLHLVLFMPSIAYGLGPSLRYARSAVLAGRKATELKIVAARAADVASLSNDMGQVYLLYMAKAGHIRRF